MIDRMMIQEILAKPFAGGRVWSLQGLGMLRTYLDDDQRERLHVWSTEHAFEDVSTVHDHPWDFRSTIVSGTVTNQIFTLSDGDDHSAEEWFHSKIFCGEGGGIVGEVDKVWLREEPPKTYGPGESYFQLATQLHESQPSDGAVTVIARTFREDRDLANVYWDQGDWVTAEPRPATQDEVLAITGKAYSLMSS